MSIILRALKNAKEKGAAPRAISLNKENGFFYAKDILIKKSSPFDSLKKPRILLLGLLFVASLVFCLAAWFFYGRNQTQAPPAVEPTPSQAPSNQTTETQKELPSQVNQASLEELIKRAGQAFEAKDYDSSAQLFEQALSASPRDPSLHNSLGLVYLKKELFSSAADEFQKSLELDSRCAECFNNLGYLKSLLGESLEAKKYLEKALEILANYPDPYFNLGVLYEKEGDIAGAVKNYREFLKYYPDPVDPLAAQVKERLRQLTGL